LNLLDPLNLMENPLTILVKVKIKV
jgi:hypothetical protein